MWSYCERVSKQPTGTETTLHPETTSTQQLPHTDEYEPDTRFIESDPTTIDREIKRRERIEKRASERLEAGEAALEERLWEQGNHPEQGGEGFLDRLIQSKQSPL